MKLKQWLREEKHMAYAEYKALPDIDRWCLEGDFRYYNAQLQKKQAAIRNNKTVWRPATEEEKKKMHAQSEKERQRYETSLKIGGIDERGNYTALHYRWEEKNR